MCALMMWFERIMKYHEWFERNTKLKQQMLIHQMVIKIFAMVKFLFWRDVALGRPIPAPRVRFRRAVPGRAVVCRQTPSKLYMAVNFNCLGDVNRGKKNRGGGKKYGGDKINLKISPHFAPQFVFPVVRKKRSKYPYLILAKKLKNQHVYRKTMHDFSCQTLGILGSFFCLQK